MIYPKRDAILVKRYRTTPGQRMTRNLLLWSLALAALGTAIAALAGWVAPWAWAELHTFAREIGGAG